MKYSRKQLIDSILFFSRLYNLEPNFQAILKISNIPNVVKDVIHLLFVNKFCYYNCPEEQYDHYRILLEYSLELQEKGYVEFNK